MKRISLGALVTGISLLIAAAFSYFYAASWMGELPVVNYPFRYLALPFLIVGIILTITGVVLEISSRAK